MVPAKVLGGVLALAVGIVLRLGEDRRAALARVPAVGVGVVDADHEGDVPGRRLGGARLGDRDRAFAERELGAVIPGVPALGKPKDVDRASASPR